MNSKQNAVFWIGLILIVANFWVSGQSTTLWQTFSVKNTSGLTGQKGKAKFTKGPGAAVKTTIPGICPKGYLWDSSKKICIQELG